MELMEIQPACSRHKCFDRTPLLIGIVILPLAASYAFSFGGFQFSRYSETPGKTNEIRVLLSDRDRREESVIAIREDGGDQQRRQTRLHAPPDIVGGFSVALAAPDLSFSRQLKPERVNFLHLLPVLARTLPTRGPPVF